MQERTGLVTIRSNPLTLVGTPLAVGDAAPDFEVLSNDLKPVRLSDLGGKVRVLVSVPSLDTPVCDMETRRFNREAAAFAPDVEILAVSMDLPFAQARWCQAAGVERVRAVSDHRAASFGHAFGVLIKELRLLARAVFVVDRTGRVAYAQLVPEVTAEPDYDAALTAIRQIAGG